MFGWQAGRRAPNFLRANFWGWGQMNQGDIIVAGLNAITDTVTLVVTADIPAGTVLSRVQSTGRPPRVK